MHLSTRLFAAFALALAVGLATAVSPYASSRPDGLEKVASEQGFLERGAEHGDAPLAGYAFPGIGDERLATGAAGFAGTLGVFAVAVALARLLRRRASAVEAPAAVRGPAG